MYEKEDIIEWTAQYLYNKFKTGNFVFDYKPHEGQLT